jgi:hypothetical protein
MPYIKTNRALGRKVILTADKVSMAGRFQKGDIVTITGVDDYRGYTFSDEAGNKVIEAGWEGFVKLEET